jgi:DNA-binding response OmpR family regulator
MKILVADDSPVLLAAVTKLLEPAGYEVVKAQDGVEAITRFYEQKPDLVLLDVSMPKLTGYVVCRLIKEDTAFAHIPVLILTARDSEEDRYWGAQSGADGYLTKDTLGDGLLHAIRSALATRALTELNRGAAAEPPVLGEADVLTWVCEMLDRKLFEATVVNELTAIGNRALQLDETVNEMLTATRRLVKFDLGALAQLDDLSLHVRSEVAATDTELDQVATYAARKLQSVTSDAIAAEDMRVVESVASDGPLPDRPGFESLYGGTLRVRGAVLGVLVLASRRGGVFTDPVIRTLRAMEPAMGAVLESGIRFQQALSHEATANLRALGGF